VDCGDFFAEFEELQDKFVEERRAAAEAEEAEMAAEKEAAKKAAVREV
jgi:hypothetical protein